MIKIKKISYLLEKKTVLMIAAVFIFIIFALMMTGQEHSSSEQMTRMSLVPTDKAGQDGAMELVQKIAIDAKNRELFFTDQLKKLEANQKVLEKERDAQLKNIETLIKQNKPLSEVEHHHTAISEQDIEQKIANQIQNAMQEIKIQSLHPLGQDYAIEDEPIKHEISWINDLSGQQVHQENLSNGEYLEELKANSVEKHYTIPQNATLMKSVLLTPLIGRVPVSGKVTSPYPFKIMVGKENLASNGISIPNVQGIVAQGEAIGDMALSCSSGQIHSLTFTFSDGTIVTKNGKKGAPLGFISSSTGNPCIPGQFITNAAEFLTTQTALAALESAGDVLKESQQTRVVNPEGDASSTLTGSIKDSMIGGAASGGARSAREWHSNRIKDSFDVVYVKQGTEVALHIETDIHIDKTDSSRKVVYEQTDLQSAYSDLD